VFIDESQVIVKESLKWHNSGNKHQSAIHDCEYVCKSHNSLKNCRRNVLESEDDESLHSGHYQLLLVSEKKRSILIINS
jgi:hypothetical protein